MMMVMMMMVMMMVVVVMMIMMMMMVMLMVVVVMMMMMVMVVVVMVVVVMVMMVAMMMMIVWTVLEWTGDSKNAVRSAQIQLQYDDERCCLVLTSHNKSVLRVVDFLRHDKLLIWASSDKQRNHLLIHVPREYDLVSTGRQHLDLLILLVGLLCLGVVEALQALGDLKKEFRLSS